MSDSNVRLADMISALREQLVQAQAEGKDSPIRFELEEAEVEVQFTVSKDVEAGGGVNFWVYNVKAGGGLSSESVQKLRIRLRPPETTLISDTDTLADDGDEHDL